MQMAAAGHAIACHIPLDELRKVEPVISVPEEAERIHARQAVGAGED